MEGQLIQRLLLRLEHLLVLGRTCGAWGVSNLRALSLADLRPLAASPANVVGPMSCSHCSLGHIDSTDLLGCFGVTRSDCVPANGFLGPYLLDLLTKTNRLRFLGISSLGCDLTRPISVAYLP